MNLDLLYCLLLYSQAWVTKEWQVSCRSSVLGIAKLVASMAYEVLILRVWYEEPFCWWEWWLQWGWTSFLFLFSFFLISWGGPLFFRTNVISLEFVLERQVSFLGLRHGWRGEFDENGWSVFCNIGGRYRLIQRPCIRILSHFFFISTKDFIRNKWSNFMIMQV